MRPVSAASTSLPPAISMTYLILTCHPRLIRATHAQQRHPSLKQLLASISRLVRPKVLALPEDSLFSTGKTDSSLCMWAFYRTAASQSAQCKANRSSRLTVGTPPGAYAFASLMR